MGGPWKARDFDPLAWRQPPPRVTARSPLRSVDAAGRDPTRLVLAYVAAVLGSCGVLLLLWLASSVDPIALVLPRLLP